MSHRNRLLRSAVLLVVGAGLLLGACSSDEEPDPTVTGTLPSDGGSLPADGSITASSYIERANAICRDADAQIAAASDTEEPAQGESAGSDFENQPLDATAGAIGENTLMALKDIPMPSGDEALIESGYDQMQQAIDTAKTDPSAPASPIGLPNQELYDYGLTDCFSQPEPAG